MTTIVAIFAVIVIFHMSGFRIGPGVSIVRVGTLVVTDLPEGASIYVDDSYNRRTSGSAKITLIPGSHHVIVSVDGHQPWSELVAIESDTETKVRPLVVPTRMNIEEIEDKDGLAKVTATKLPTVAAPLTMAGGCALVSVSGNRIIADATTTPGCTPPPYLCSEGSCGPTVIFSPLEPMHSVISYPGRDDALIVSVGRTLFVLELDPREPGYFAPLVRGTNPKAAPWDEDSIVVLVGPDLFLITL